MVVDELPTEVVDEVFRALADSTRRDILRRCATDEPSVSRLAQAYPMSFAVRTSSDPMNSVTAVTGAIHQAAPDLPIVDVMSMNEVIAQSVSPQRFNMLLLASFAGLALVLAAVGIYSVLSYLVAQRTREIGIRSALGAQPRQLLWGIFGRAMRQLSIGLAVGSLISMAALSAAGIGPGLGGALLVTVAAIITIVATFATLGPARRSLRLPTVDALRADS